ncbi:ACP S-malonyltransferase [Actinokineospora auranticolor]|uniref:[acyl-carrier-protein] S-malonyltransferase n=1 Tax=Actinokineospora auranticolor TaxID=155976 RepID=A0A2S6GPQ7_9PSEU|nr:ACP S-malonyltransferase [Actinokineospora auranticolor]PPK67111.1 trans-AT polyketide synthase/acyltransferase/oxidoreductase domain-containing protein [Actinokineospora auranticolor]
MTPAQRERLPVVFMFSGQGSQYYRMGRDLYDSNAVFRAALDRHDATVRAELGESVLAAVFDPGKRRDELFTDTRLTHPAIVMVELAAAEMLRAAGVRPAYLLGSSLGEYAAAVVAGCLSAADCLRLLVDQARCLRSAPPGGMLAVLAGPEAHDLAPALADCEVAARNYPGHFVVAGTTEAIGRAEAQLRAADVLHQRVPVEHGYHSRLMDGVLRENRDALRAVRFAPAQVPWVSCVDGSVVDRPTADHFARVVRAPIEFGAAMAALADRGEFLYLDLGPGGTLHNFARNTPRSGSRSWSMPLFSPFGHDPGVVDRARDAAADPAPVPPAPARKAHVVKVYGFPGQGSQRRGMGAELFERYPEHTATADRVLGYSIRELCVDDPRRELARTEFTQPALYVVSALTWLDRRAADPTPPDYLVGHSLGEYVALFAAGVFDFETGLRLVHRRGALMAAAGGGSMAAVVGTDEPTITRVLAEAGLTGLDLANHNAPDQFVLSGPDEEIGRACAAFEAAGARAVRLHVSAPFHSRHMRGTAEEFAPFLAGFPLADPVIPVLANIDAKPYRPGEVAKTLTAQIAAPVRWTETVRSLMGLGEFEFVELGPGQVLTKLVAKIRAAADPLAAPALPATAVPAATAPAAAVPAVPAAPDADSLGARTFRERYGLRRAYLAGSLYGGVSGREMLGSLAKAGLLGFLGTGGLAPAEVEHEVRGLVGDLGLSGAFGANVLYRHGAPEEELGLVDVLLRHGVDLVEASGFPVLTPALVKFRLKGGRILAKVARTDIAAEFLAPPPEHLVRRLVADGAVTEAEAAAAATRPVADDLCVEADGGWVTANADLLTLLPAVRGLRDRSTTPSGHHVHIGCAGGIGSPAAAAAAFLLGADFILTGSVNQCSVEAATSPAVKDLLHQAHEYDIETAPWGPLFELGARARYLKRGLFFPARASRLHELWRRHGALSELDSDTRAQVLTKYLGGVDAPTPTGDGKADLAKLFRGYFDRGLRSALAGDTRSRVDFLVHCGPAMGAFNQVVEGTSLDPWQARTVEAIADTLLEGAATHIADRLAALR